VDYHAPASFARHVLDTMMMTSVTALLDSAASASSCSRRLAAVALGALSAIAPAAVGAVDFRGFASAGPLGVILFQPCEGKTLSPRTFRVEDDTPDGALMAGIDDVRAIMLNSGRPLYVEFRGDAKGILVTARQFQRAVGTAESCIDAPRDIPAAARFWAGGGDPGWRFVVTAQGAQFERPGEKPIRFPAAPFLAPSRHEGARFIDAWSSLDGGTVRVEITEQMCSDGRSETAYGATVMLRYGSRSYEGCAARF
jgi:uncharacterized membrane protein